MQIQASVRSSASGHEVVVNTDGRTSSLAVPGRDAGGSARNGGELLCAALATCYCNDLYREASSADVEALLRATDAVAEVQNTLRAGLMVQLCLADDRQESRPA